MKSKLNVDVNKNPTKTGIKVQFVLPETLEGDKKTEATQKLQSKLNQGLSQYNLTVSQDTDVPYANVIGFLIPIADIKLLIKNAMGGGSSEEPAPEETPTPEAAPEEPMKEINRMKELAGLNEAVSLMKYFSYGDKDISDKLMGLESILPETTDSEKVAKILRDIIDGAFIKGIEAGKKSMKF